MDISYISKIPIKSRSYLVHIRLELSGPGVQYIADNQLYNAIITAHAILMIFFMVENFRLNFKSQPCLNTEKIGDDNNNILIIGKAKDNGGNKNYQDPKQKYVKILVNDPFNNRDVILKVTKKQKGIISRISSSMQDQYWSCIEGKVIFIGIIYCINIIFSSN